MKTLALLLGLIAPTLGLAASYSIKAPDGDFVQLYEDACPVSSGWLKWKKAAMRYQGKDFKACWTQYRGQVVIADEAGDISMVPVEAFKKDQAL